MKIIILDQEWPNCRLSRPAQHYMFLIFYRLLCFTWQP